MGKVIIGTQGEAFDLDTLLPTRALIQANSGGGKSYLIRRMVEQTFGKVQIIIIDPEGEFATLREKFDFILVGKGGETPADPRSAALLAEKLLELNASAICDIYELKALDRHRWVRLFLDALINAPKNLWHPVLIIVDEAHVFAPEKGQGESEAIGAMMDLATRGRKRGFCMIAATQRIGKLSKNVSAELQNVLIGSTFQDIDRKRAAETLGVPKAEERAFFDQVKLLEPGNFFALGRAISRERIMITIAKVSTSHPQQGGKYKAAPPPPSDKVKSLLPSLKDLPQEAEEKLRTVADLKKEIVELKKQVKAIPAPTVGPIQFMPLIKDEQLLRLERIYANMTKEAQRHGEAMAIFWKDSHAVNTVMLAAVKSFDESKKVAPVKPTPTPPQRVKNTQFVDTNVMLGKCERSLLSVLATRQNVDTNKSQLAVLSGYSKNSSGFSNAISKLSVNQYITRNSDKLSITTSGFQILGDFKPLPEGEDLQRYWFNNLGKAEETILKVLVKHYPGEVEKSVVAEESNYSITSSGFLNALSKLRVLELISGSNQLKASDNLF